MLLIEAWMVYFLYQGFIFCVNFFLYEFLFNFFYISVFLVPLFLVC